MAAELLPTVAEQHIDSMIERFTFKRGRSCRISPLVQLDDALVICPPLITPRAIDGLVLRSTAYKPDRYGPVGHRQGSRAVRWRDWLSQIPGVLVADRVRVLHRDGRSAGDLDVVAVDPERRRGICLEIKWPIDAVELTDAIKTEKLVESAVLQADRLRSQLASAEAVARLPHGWPEFHEIDWTWAVGTPQQLCVRPLPVPDIRATSLRYVLAHGLPNTLADLIDLIVSPDLPVRDLHFRIENLDLRLGRDRVIQEAIAISDRWQPSAWA